MRVGKNWKNSNQKRFFFNFFVITFFSRAAWKTTRRRRQQQQHQNKKKDTTKTSSIALDHRAYSRKKIPQVRRRRREKEHRASLLPFLFCFSPRSLSLSLCSSSSRSKFFFVSLGCSSVLHLQNSLVALFLGAEMAFARRSVRINAFRNSLDRFTRLCVILMLSREWDWLCSISPRERETFLRERVLHFPNFIESLRTASLQTHIFDRLVREDSFESYFLADSDWPALNVPLFPRTQRTMW